MVSLCFALLLAAGAPKCEAKPLTIGLSAPTGARAALQGGEAIAAALTMALGRPVKDEPYSSYDALAEALATGKVDFAWITPVAYVKATQKNKNVTPLRKAVRGGSGYYLSALIVKTSSKAQKLDDLKGKTLAWLGPSSSSGGIFARAILEKAGKDPDKFFGQQLRLGDHKSVCEAVRDGAADVGATFADPRKDGKLEADGCRVALGDAKAFRVIASSAKIPNDVVVAGASVDADLAEDFGKALDGLGTTELGKAALAKGFACDGFAIVEDTDLDPVRAARWETD